jgi:hypothetical protein
MLLRLSKSAKKYEFTLKFKLVFEVQSNSVITNITGPSIFVRYSREFVITVSICVAFVNQENLIKSHKPT